jgi:NTE family protein
MHLPQSEIKYKLDTTSGNRPKVGVVLASGNIKAFSAIPVFEMLERENIDVDLVVGCSGGAIIAAAIGAGFSTQEIRDKTQEFVQKRLFTQKDLRSLLGMYNLPFGRFDQTSGLLKPYRIKELYQNVFQDKRLEDLNPRTLIHVTDLETGQGQVLDHGLLADAVYASGAIFPILPPIRIDGKLYADGYYTSSLPVIEAVKQMMDVVIAVIFEDPIHPSPRRFFSVFNNIYKIQSGTQIRNQIAMSIDLHDHEIILIKVPFNRTIKMWEIGAIPHIIKTGEDAVTQKREEILSAIDAWYKKKKKTA